MKDHYDYTIDSIRDALEPHGIKKDKCFGKVYRTTSGTKIGLLVIFDHVMQCFNQSERADQIRNKLQHVNLFDVESITVLTNQEYQERLMESIIDQDMGRHL